MLWAATLLVIAWFGWHARGALLPFAFGGVLAYALTPIVDRLASVIPTRTHQGDVIRRGLVVFVLYAVAAAAIFGAAVAIVPLAADQTTEFVDTLPELVDRAREETDSWLERYHDRVPPDVQRRINALANDGASTFSEAAGAWMRASIAFVTQTLTVLLTLIVVPIWMFWALRDRHFVARNLKAAVPPAVRPDVENVMAIADGLLGRYIRAQLFLGVVVGIAVGVSLTLLGVQLSVALGIWAGITELIPILGPWIGAVPGLIIILATDPSRAIWVALVYLGVQQLENNLLVPRVQGRAVDIHPAMVIVLLASWGTVFGFIGLLIAVPVTAILRELFWYLDRRFRGESPEDAFSLSLVGRHLLRRSRRRHPVPRVPLMPAGEPHVPDPAAGPPR